MQNEIISACNCIILNKIVGRVNKAKCFTMLADKTADISGTEQFSLSVCFLGNNTTREEFLQFIPIN